MNGLMDTFSNRLNEAISLRNIKPVELSEKTGIDKSKISSYMSGRYKAKQDGVYLLAKALDVSEAWLMGLNVPMERKIDSFSFYKNEIAENKKKFDDLKLTKDEKDLLLSKLNEAKNTSIDGIIELVNIKSYDDYLIEYNKIINQMYQNDFEDIKLRIAFSYLLKIDTYQKYINDFSINKYNNNIKNKIPILGRIPAGIPIELIEDIIDYEELSEDYFKGGKEYFGLKVKGNSMEPKYLDGDTLIILKQNDCESGQDAIVMVNGDDGTFKRVFKTDNGITLQPLNNEYMPMFYSNEDIKNKPVRILGIVKEIRRSV